uniref:Necrosis-and ethylene-inducing protein 5 n=1 Tax=Moniliophthora perniciosa TaxID=153609 RepID=H9XHW2_MONPR|nr:necrosis- and ethylene-inducing protein 5 [Moniliophthora perniciosa]
MQFSNLFIIIVLGAVSGALSATVKDHDKIDKLPASGSEYETTYQPKLHIGNGCYSYPAVDAEGNWSGGLKPTGAPSAACKDRTKGQTYVRTADDFKGKIAMVYAWYMPKDVVTSGFGHRHDWEGAVVFVDRKTNRTEGVACSAHGGWRKYPNPGGNNVNGTHARLQYSAEPVINTHALDLTDKDGDLPTLAQWEQIGVPAQQAINDNSHWGKANPPIADHRMLNTLEGAWMW